MTMPTQKSMAINFLLFSTLGISFGGLIMRQFETADAWQITFYRNLAFFIVIFAFTLLNYRSGSFKMIINLGMPSLIAASFLAIANICFIHSLKNTSVANTLFTLSTIPFVTAALAYFLLNEVITKRTFLIMFCAFLGISLMVSEGLRANQSVGILLAFCTALSFSSFAIILRKYRYLDMIPCLLISAILVMGTTFFARSGNVIIPLNEIAYCFFWGGILSGLVNSAFIFATRYLYASEVTLFMLLEFSLGPIWVWFFLNETISTQTLIGGIIVISSVTVYSFFQLREPTKVRTFSE